MMIIQTLNYKDDTYGDYSFSLLNLNKQLGHLNIIINFNENTATITDFESIAHNNGYGSILLDHVIKWVIDSKCKVICLDDMSERYRQTHNIYLKFGFEYLYDSGPEMELKINLLLLP